MPNREEKMSLDKSIESITFDNYTKQDNDTKDELTSKSKQFIYPDKNSKAESYINIKQLNEQLQNILNEQKSDFESILNNELKKQCKDKQDTEDSQDDQATSVTPNNNAHKDIELSADIHQAALENDPSKVTNLLNILKAFNFFNLHKQSPNKEPNLQDEQQM